MRKTLLAYCSVLKKAALLGNCADIAFTLQNFNTYDVSDTKYVLV